MDGYRELLAQLLELGDGDDAVNSIALRGTSMWLCGYVEAPGLNQKDLAVLRYDITVGLPDLVNSALSYVYPNPFSNSASIVYNSIRKNASWDLIITDVLGKEVKHVNSTTSNILTIAKK